jgi:hypothetical protein
MKRHWVTLVILLAVTAAASLLSCGGGIDDVLVTHRLNGGWIINPDADNDKNFFVIERGAVSNHGFRADTVELLESSEDAFRMVLTNGIATSFVNAAMVNSTTATYILYPDLTTGAISRVPGLTDCSQITTAWQMDLDGDGGATAPPFKPARQALGVISSFSLFFEIDSAGGMSNTEGGHFDVTGGRMICNGTELDDLVVGFMSTNAADAGPLFSEYSNIKFAGIINGTDSIGGLYDTDSVVAWPVGSFRMMVP